MRWSALLLAARLSFGSAAASEPLITNLLSPEIAQAPIGRGVFGTRIFRKPDGTIDWDVTMGRKAPPAGAAPVTIDVMPRFAQAGKTFRVRIRIASDPRNRSACFGYDGPEFSESCWDHLPGYPVTTTKFVTLRVGGFYTLTATIKRNDGTTPLAVSQACVIGHNMEALDCFPEGVAGGGLSEQSTEQSVRPPEPETRK